MAETFAEMGFAAIVTASSATPETDGYVGTFGVLPYHVHPTATPLQWAALNAAIAANAVTVNPYVAPVVPVLTIQQKATAALLAGYAISSTGTPSINGTYGTDPQTQSNFASMYNLIQRAGGSTFPGGLSTLSWPVLNSQTPVVFTNVSDFLRVETAVGNYVLNVDQAALNGTSALPLSSITIA